MKGNRPSLTLRVGARFGTNPPTFARIPASHQGHDAASSNRRRPHADHVAALIGELVTAEMPLPDAWLVASEAWMNYLRPDPGSRTEGPLDSVITSAGHAALIRAASNTTGVTAPAPFTGNNGSGVVSADSRPDRWAAGLASSREQWAQVLRTPATLTAQTAEELAAGFQHPVIRDCLMTDVITGASDPFRFVMLGLFEGRPDWARVDTAQEVAFELMKATREGQRAPMLCLIGWLEWLKGKSGFAARYLKLALEDTADYRLPVLLAEVVNRGLVADCARNPEKSYAQMSSDSGRRRAAVRR